MTKEEFIALPLSKAIRIAVDKCKEIEANNDPALVLDMGVYMNYNFEKQQCALCLGGALMLATEQITVDDLKDARCHDEPEVYTDLMDLENLTADRMKALNEIRIGQISNALMLWQNANVSYEDIFSVNLDDFNYIALFAKMCRQSEPFPYHMPWDKYLDIANSLESNGF